MQKENCQELPITVNVQGRFKAGSELSGKVNRVTLDVDQEISSEEQSFSIRLQVDSEVCGCACED